MNEHKAIKPFIMQKQGNEWVRIEIPRQTDIEVQACPVHLMGHYVGEGRIKEVRLGLPKSVWGSK